MLCMFNALPLRDWGFGGDGRMGSDRVDESGDTDLRTSDNEHDTGKTGTTMARAIEEAGAYMICRQHLRPCEAAASSDPFYQPTRSSARSSAGPPPTLLSSWTCLKL